MSGTQKMTKALKKLPSQMPPPDRVASDVTDAVWETMSLLVQEQADLFIDLGQTREERHALSIKIASSLYRTGFSTLSAKKLHRLLRKEELWDLVYDYLCLRPQMQAQRYLYTCLIKRKEYARYVVKPKPPTRSAAADGANSVPEVSTKERGARCWRGNGRIGARRDARRTSRCESRTMPE